MWLRNGEMAGRRPYRDSKSIAQNRVNFDLGLAESGKTIPGLSITIRKMCELNLSNKTYPEVGLKQLALFCYMCTNDDEITGKRRLDFPCSSHGVAAI